MRIFQSVALAVMLVLGLGFSAMAQSAAPAEQCVSVEQFKTEVLKQDPSYNLVVLQGDALQTFAANMDRITGGGHGDMDAIALLSPDGNENDITTLAIFVKGCYAGNADIPTQMVKEALKGVNV